jgi:hypothetical protein
VRKIIMMAGVATMLLVVSQRQAEAVPFTVAGSATGAFNGASPTDVATLGPLTFNGNEAFSFEGSYDELLNTYTGGIGSFGTFSLGFDPFSYSGQTFALNLTFTSPVGILPNPTLLSTTLRGAVLEDTHRGLVNIVWDGPATLTFEGGSFDLVFDDVMWLKSGLTLEQTGTVRASVPEPASILLLGSALCFAGASRRRLLLLRRA